MLTSVFIWKKATYFGKNSTLTQGNIIRTVRNFVVLFSVYVRQKIVINESTSFTDHASRFVRDTKFGTIVSNEKLLKGAAC